MALYIGVAGVGEMQLEWFVLFVTYCMWQHCFAVRQRKQNASPINVKRHETSNYCLLKTRDQWRRMAFDQLKNFRHNCASTILPLRTHENENDGPFCINVDAKMALAACAVVATENELNFHKNFENNAPTEGTLSFLLFYRNALLRQRISTYPWCNQCHYFAISISPSPSLS